MTMSPRLVVDRDIIHTPLHNVCAWGICDRHRMRPGIGGRLCAEHELLYIAEYGKPSKLLPEEIEFDRSNPLVQIALEREKAVGAHETGR